MIKGDVFKNDKELITHLTSHYDRLVFCSGIIRLQIDCEYRPNWNDFCLIASLIDKFVNPKMFLRFTTYKSNNGKVWYLYQNLDGSWEVT